MTEQSFDTLWRDYETDGVSSSGAHKPLKADIRDTLNAKVGSAIAGREVVKTDSYTVLTSEAGWTFIANKGTALTFALPSAATAAAAVPSATKFQIRIFNIGAGTLTIDGDGAETINGELTVELSQWEGATLWTDGTSWRADLGGGDPDPNSITETMLADSLGLKLATVVANRTALLALSTSRYNTAWLAEAGREGLFAWDGSDLSSAMLGASKASSAVDDSAETISFSSNHWLTTGQTLIVTTAVNGLSTNTLYYAIRVDDDTIKLASSYANALAGTAVNLTGTSATTVRKHLDPTHGIYVTPTADITGASGAWKRVRGQRECSGLNIMWFGATRGADSTQHINCAAEFSNKGFWGGSGSDVNETFVAYPDGIFLVDPTVGVRLRDYARHIGQGVGSTIIKAANTSAGNLFYRQYSGGNVSHERVNHVEIAHIRGVVTGVNQNIFNLEHIGRCRVHHVMGTTQDRDDEYNNALQEYHAGSTLFKIAVGDSVANGYVNGSDVMELSHFEAHFLGYGVRSAAAANQKAPETLKIHHFEISDCHEPIVLNAGAAMLPYIGYGEVQRWGNDAINEATSSAGADNYGIDYVANKMCIEHIYFEGDSAFAAIITRSGTANVVKTARLNRYGTTTTLHADSGTSTVTSD